MNLVLLVHLELSFLLVAGGNCHAHRCRDYGMSGGALDPSVVLCSLMTYDGEALLTITARMALP